MARPIKRLVGERMEAFPVAVSCHVECTDLTEFGHIAKLRAAVFAMRVFEEHQLVTAAAVEGLHDVGREEGSRRDRSECRPVSHGDRCKERAAWYA